MACKGLYACNSKFNKVTHVIFDLDGTIFDSETLYGKAMEIACNHYGIQYQTELRAKYAGSPTNVACKIVMDHYGINAPLEEFREIFNTNANNLFPQVNFMPGIEKLINHLHNNNIPIAIATSSLPESFEIKFKNFQDYLKMFHHYVLTSDPEVKKGKPNPDIFLVAAQRFDEKPAPASCLVLEDSHNGMKAAINAAMQCVMIPEYFVSEELRKGATLVLRSAEELKPELFGLPPFPSTK